MESPLLNKIDQHFLIPLAVQWLEKMSRGTVMAIGLILLAGIAELDYATGVTVSMAPFYLLPIGLIALRWGWIVSFLMSALSGVVWVSLDWRYAERFSIWPDAWNIAMRVGVFVLFALVLSRIKWDIMQEVKLTADLQAALAEVKQLSGLLPICAWCKRIRDENGNWEAIESYFSDHSDADFTHGICPDCARKYHHIA